MRKLGGIMKIECLYSEGCASREALKANIDTALHLEELDAQVLYRVVTEEEAGRLGIAGSPTVWINGRDVEGLKVLHGGVS
jgi:hypothetical protein